MMQRRRHEMVMLVGKNKEQWKWDLGWSERKKRLWCTHAVLIHTAISTFLSFWAVVYTFACLQWELWRTSLWASARPDLWDYMHVPIGWEEWLICYSAMPLMGFTLWSWIILFTDPAKAGPDVHTIPHVGEERRRPCAAVQRACRHRLCFMSLPTWRYLAARTNEDETVE